MAMVARERERQSTREVRMGCLTLSGSGGGTLDSTAIHGDYD